MSDHTEADGLRERLTKQGEDTLGKMAEDLMANPLVSGAIQRAFDAREKASAAQEAAMGALNIPSAADIERLTRRVRSVSQRLEGIEDGIDRIDERVASNSVDDRLAAIEVALATLGAQVAALSASLPREAGAKPKAASARKPKSPGPVKPKAVAATKKPATARKAGA